MEYNFELNYDKKYNLSKFKKMNLQDYKKFKLFAEFNLNIESPIFRGLCSNFFVKNNYFYKEYLFEDYSFIICLKIIESPKFFITGHLLDSGIFSEYLYLGILPKINELKKFNSNNDKIKYAIINILKNLGLKEDLNIKIIDNKKDFTNYDFKQVDKGSIERMVNSTFNFLKIKYL
ncbi:MAG: hypothetical protein PHR26_00160 [Candidatus ainarchaeum sp.]|nr:hypothetical protein [Candidatus ainarchaeum sp.]MDD3976067.1 hypothetical protein [Candidatus ainarchaeum sp.]